MMLLNLQELVLPVSIGPGIMKLGTDGLPVQRGIDTARRDGGTAVWCHNRWGFEHIPNWVLGRLDAQNIFDGGAHGSYKDSFYRFLNAGLRVPFSTGTDWFIYDFARVFVPVADDKLTANRGSSRCRPVEVTSRTDRCWSSPLRENQREIRSGWSSPEGSKLQPKAWGGSTFDNWSWFEMEKSSRLLTAKVWVSILRPRPAGRSI